MIVGFGSSDIIDGRELPVDRFFQHDLADDFIFGNAEFLGLLRNLTIDERGAHVARSDDVETNFGPERASERQGHRVQRGFGGGVGD